MEINFRPMRREDVPQAIECIRDAYGESYVKPYLYTEEGLWSHHESGVLNFSVATTAEGELAGIIANEVSPVFPGQTEIACQVVFQRYSGYGLALPLALYQMERAEQGAFQSQFARALGCHLISQKTLTDMGFTHCGFLLSVFDRMKLTTHFRADGNLKISQMVAVKRQRIGAATPLFMPEEYRPLAESMYRQLGLSWSPLEQDDVLQGEGLWEWEQDAAHNTLLLIARRPGAEFAQALHQVLTQLHGRPLQTINLLLNLSCTSSAAAYAAAIKLDFIFTGFLPCGEGGEYIILHNAMGVPVDMSQMPYLQDYEPYAKEIGRGQYEKRTEAI